MVFLDESAFGLAMSLQSTEKETLLATINLTSGKALEPALTTLDVPGDKEKGWYSQSEDDLGNYGARMSDLGCDEATVSNLNAGVDGLLGFIDDASASADEFKRDSVLRYGVDENGGLAGIGMPLVKADAEGNLVCAIGDNVLPMSQDAEGTFTLGSLSGPLQPESGANYTSYRLRLSSKGSGDRYLVKVNVKDGVEEDEILDLIEAGESIAPLLKVVGQTGSAINMADLDIGNYDVIGVKEMKGAEGRPPWYILQLADGREVKSRSKTDTQLRNGLDVEMIRSKGNHLLLSITGRRPFGQDKVQVDCGLLIVPPDRAAKKLAATTAALDEAAIAAPAAKPAATKAAPAEPAEKESPAPKSNRAAKAAASRKAKATAVAEPEVDSTVSLEF